MPVREDDIPLREEGKDGGYLSDIPAGTQHAGLVAHEISHLVHKLFMGGVQACDLTRDTAREGNRGDQLHQLSPVLIYLV